MTHHAEPREVPAVLAGTTPAQARLERLHVGNARTLGRIDGTVGYFAGLHARTHLVFDPKCDLCAFLFQLAVLLRLEQP